MPDLCCCDGARLPRLAAVLRLQQGLPTAQQEPCDRRSNSSQGDWHLVWQSIFCPWTRKQPQHLHSPWLGSLPVNPMSSSTMVGSMGRSTCRSMRHGCCKTCSFWDSAIVHVQDTDGPLHSGGCVQTQTCLRKRTVVSQQCQPTFTHSSETSSSANAGSRCCAVSAAAVARVPASTVRLPRPAGSAASLRCASHRVCSAARCCRGCCAAPNGAET